MPSSFWPVVARIALLVALEAAFAVIVKRLRRGPAAARASLWKRAGTWIALACAAFALAAAGPWALALALVAVAIPAIRELASVARAAGWPARPLAAQALAIAFIASAAVAGVAAVGAVAVVTLAFAALVAARERGALRAVVGTLGAGAYVGIPLALLVVLRREPDGFAVVVSALAIVSFCDVTSMIGGLAAGRRPLAPRLSPNKTVEGSLLGLTAAAITAATLRFALPPIPLAALLAGAVVIGAAGIAGDLTASALKRAASVKDYGGLLPGHGGVMDRIDSLLTAVPLTWFLIVTFAR